MEQIRQIVEAEVKNKRLKAFDSVYGARRPSYIKYWATGILLFLIVLLFMPWTQNIRARGIVTTLRQEQRPQELPAIIGGRIVKWYVKEGDLVQAGDTIAQLAEIKDSYLDPQLLSRTQEQIRAKSASVVFYGDKVRATDAQMVAMERARILKVEQLGNKLRQLQLKILSDSMDLASSLNDVKIAEEQYRRQLVMRDSGLVSLVQVEQRNQAFQQATAKKISAEVKLANTRTDLTNTYIEQNQINQEYSEKIFKSRGDRASAESDIAGGQAEIAKLSNQYSNYSIREGYYFLKAPQSGQITGAAHAGINEIVKEGETLVKVVPRQMQYAIELFVRPVDLPLLSRGQKARFQFDGFPAIVFSGWPSASYGTFGGTVVAIENSISTNGKFRVLLSEDKDDRPWPVELKVGAGAQGIALLKDVPIWYELWRNINGFPPDYYKPVAGNNEKK
ncbi:MAG: HlyD family efflux transporter periplasmic adaptor subunit [Chitinophagaceae bacterium]|nr:HlyD family efflux transporter periplasmic adaptor subunit [Chitinophagaceae bacterium]